MQSFIWNTLIPSCPKLPDDIDDSNDNDNDEDDDDNYNNDEDDDLSPMPIKSEEADYTC